MSKIYPCVAQRQVDHTQRVMMARRKEWQKGCSFPGLSQYCYPSYRGMMLCYDRQLCMIREESLLWIKETYPWDFQNQPRNHRRFFVRRKQVLIKKISICMYKCHANLNTCICKVQCSSCTFDGSVVRLRSTTRQRAYIGGPKNRRGRYAVR